MPLVTRQANQGNLFKTPTEPDDWLDSDLWSDETNHVLNLNNDGTAEDVGENAALVFG